MKVINKLMLVVGSLVALPVLAQTCDLEGSVTITYDGKPDSKVTAVGYGLPMDEIDRIHKRALKVVDVASKVQDKGGNHMIEFDEAWICNGVKTKGQGVAGVMVQGVTLQGATKIARMAEKQFGEQIHDDERRASKGKKRAGGRD